jgi:hypothetical protein
MNYLLPLRIKASHYMQALLSLMTGMLAKTTLTAEPNQQRLGVGTQRLWTLRHQKMRWILRRGFWQALPL